MKNGSLSAREQLLDSVIIDWANTAWGSASLHAAKGLRHLSTCQTCREDLVPFIQARFTSRLPPYVELPARNRARGRHPYTNTAFQIWIGGKRRIYPSREAANAHLGFDDGRGQPCPG